MRKLIKPIDIYKQEDGEAYLIRFKLNQTEGYLIEKYLSGRDIKYVYADSVYQVTAEDYLVLKDAMDILALFGIL